MKTKLSMYLTPGDRIVLGHDMHHVYGVMIHPGHAHVYLDDGGYTVTLSLYEEVALDD